MWLLSLLKRWEEEREEGSKGHLAPKKSILNHLRMMGLNTHHLIWAVDSWKALLCKVNAATQIQDPLILTGAPWWIIINSNIPQTIFSRLPGIKITIQIKKDITSLLRTNTWMGTITMDRISTRGITGTRRIRITKGTGVGKVKLSSMGSTTRITAQSKNMWSNNRERLHLRTIKMLKSNLFR